MSRLDISQSGYSETIYEEKRILSERIVVLVRFMIIQENGMSLKMFSVGHDVRAYLECESGSWFG